MYKRWLAFVISAVMTGTLLSGCSGGAKEPGPPPAGSSASAASTESSSSKTINILMESVPDTEIVQEHLAEFEQETGIKVNIESINYSSMHEKLLTQMLGGTNAYDVVVVDCYWTGEFVKAGWLEDLGPYIERDGFDTSMYADSMMEMVGQVDGVTYMLPFYNYMMALIYRTDVFQDQELKSGYEQKFSKPFEIPQTLEEYVEMCKYITGVKGEKLSGVVMQGLRPDPIAVEWLNYLYTCGGDFYDDQGNIVINSGNGVKALDLYIDNMQNAAPKGAAGYGFDEAFNVFAQGNAATYVTYNWMVPKLNKNDESSVQGLVDIAPLPDGVSLNAGRGWGIPHNAPDKDASWEFLKWVESFPIAKARAMDGGSPTRYDVMEDPEVLEAYPYIAEVQKIMAESKILPVMEIL